MKSRFILILNLFLLQPTFAEYLYKSEVIGNYIGKDSTGADISATVSDGPLDNSHFPKVLVRVGDEFPPVELGLDVKNAKFRGFISYDCNNPTCLNIFLYEI